MLIGKLINEKMLNRIFVHNVLYKTKLLSKTIPSSCGINYFFNTLGIIMFRPTAFYRINRQIVLAIAKNVNHISFFFANKFRIIALHDVQNV